MEWGFTYSGPRLPGSDPRCTTCLAGMRKECPAHGSAFVSTCAHCRSAQGAPCQGHWGLEAAFDAYVARDEASKKDFEFARSIVNAEPAGDKPNIVVTMRGDGILAADGHREIFIRIDARS